MANVAFEEGLARSDARRQDREAHDALILSACHPLYTANQRIVVFSRLTRAALYVSALTLEDWRQNCDRRRTDAAVHMRDGRWYRARLRRYFHEIGAGFWLRRGAPITVWELETAG